MHTPLQLREQVLLVAAIVGLEDQGTRRRFAIVGQVEPVADFIVQP
jgi:hypothetical protein